MSLHFLPRLSFSKLVPVRDQGSLVLAVVGTLFLFGCDVPLASDVFLGPSENSCESSSDCGAGTCRRGICQADATEIPALLLEITPPAGAVPISGVSFTSVVDEVSRDPGGYELTLGHVSVVAGVVVGQKMSATTCLQGEATAGSNDHPIAEDGSLPARLTLIPRSRLLGLPNPSFSSEVDEPAIKAGSSSYPVSITAPPGRYDFYVEPLALEGGCVRPPTLIVDQEVLSGNVALNLMVSAPELLSVVVRYPQTKAELSGWAIDIVERDSGRLLSNTGLLDHPQKTAEGWDYSVAVAFSHVIGEESYPGAELVRLSPPAGVVAPTIYVERSVVDLFQDGKGLIDQLTKLPEPVHFSGRVARLGSPSPVLSTVTFLATSLDSTSAGTVAAFSRTIQTLEDGSFELELLPGTYRLLAEPLDGTLARAEVELTVSGLAETQIGKTIEVSVRSPVTGTLVGFAGSAVRGASISARSAFAGGASSLLEFAQGEYNQAPTAGSDSTDEDGAFDFPVDPGRFDVVARPDSTTGYAWAVLLGVEVGAGALDLGKVVLPLPVAVEGTLNSLDLGGAVPNAVIRAYAFLKEGALVRSIDEADSVIAVGESRVDAEGNYRLLLPALLK